MYDGEVIELGSVNRHDPDDDPHLIYPRKINLSGKGIKEVLVSFRAKDQGWGNRKGQVILRLEGQKNHSQ